MKIETGVRCVEGKQDRCPAYFLQQYSNMLGGDEFVILTNSEDENYAKSICTDIISHNKECIVWNNKEIFLHMPL